MASRSRAGKLVVSSKGLKASPAAWQATRASLKQLLLPDGQEEVEELKAEKARLQHQVDALTAVLRGLDTTTQDALPQNIKDTLHAIGDASALVDAPAQPGDQQQQQGPSSAPAPVQPAKRPTLTRGPTLPSSSIFSRDEIGRKVRDGTLDKLTAKQALATLTTTYQPLTIRKDLTVAALRAQVRRCYQEKEHGSCYGALRCADGVAVLCIDLPCR